MSTREQLMSMEVGKYMDVVFSNGILRATKELYKESDNEFDIHNTNGGWYTATVTLEEAVDYCEGRLRALDLEWK